ncbi:hypothetical protein CRX72_23715 [Pantoea sp. BRM17]|nr:hypothetical protein CRX72_23715 [Pantoea sp. BRM17]
MPLYFQATPQTVLTAAQCQDLLNQLFSRRAERGETLPLTDSVRQPQPIWAPFTEILPRPLAQRPALSLITDALKLVNLKSGDPVPSRHFPLLTQYLQVRQTLGQHSAPTLQLLESSLKQPLNRDEQLLLQDYSQQRTVLSALSQDQLRQVLTMLQNGQMAIPQPQQSRSTDRTLLPAEQQALNQQVTRLAATTGESPVKLLIHEVGVKSDADFQSRHFPAAEQHLNRRLSQVQDSHATRQLLQQLQDKLPQGNNRQAVSDFIRQQFNPMQPLSGPGVPAGDRSALTGVSGPARPGGPAGEQPLSPAQRTTLERLIVRIMSLSTLKAPELWAGVRGGRSPGGAIRLETLASQPLQSGRGGINPHLLAFLIPAPVDFPGAFAIICPSFSGAPGSDSFFKDSGLRPAADGGIRHLWLYPAQDGFPDVAADPRLCAGGNAGAEPAPCALNQ